MPTLLFPLAAWVFALKLASDDQAREPLVLGAAAGAVFALFAWFDVIALHGQSARAALATPLYVVTGALLVKLFSRVEGVLLGVIVVVLGTAVMFGLLPGVVELVVPDRASQAEHASRLSPNPAFNRTPGLAPGPPVKFRA